MKLKITDQIKELFFDAKTWAELELEYIKLTAAEKFTVFTATLIMGAICVLLGFIAVILLSFAMVELFKLILCPALAFTAAGGVVLLLTLLVYLLRKPILLNPIAKFITKLLLEHAAEHKS